MIDIQAEAGASRFAIASVGITNFNYPVRVRDAQSGTTQPTTSRWQMGVSLAADKRGTHMSRFITELHARAAEPFDLDGHLAFAAALGKTLRSDDVDLTTSFSWFREVAAPVSGQKALIDCEAQWRSLVRGGAPAKKILVVNVPAKALCPCSKAISERGAHNQRSDIRVELAFAPAALHPGIDRVIGLVETSASSPVYPLLKREDEKFVTEAAYDNPVFVEDIVRNVAEKLFDLPDLTEFAVEAINRESIHKHDCFARIAYCR
jgi:GTP cyclohydrolase I